MSFLLPHFLKEGRGKLDVYFTRVYNPLWTNPDGFSWMEVLQDEAKIGLHVALTPTWSETAWFADYILPMGLGTERHDTMSQETHAGQWLGFRQPVLRVAREKRGEPIDAHPRSRIPAKCGRRAEFWVALSLEDRSGRRARHPQVLREPVPSRRADHDGRVLRLDVRELGARVCPRRPRRRSLTPLQYMRKYGVFQVTDNVSLQPRRTSDALTADEQAATASTSVVVDGVPRAGFNTPSRKLEFYSPTLAAWGWPEHAMPRYVPGPRALARPEARRRASSICCRTSACRRSSTRARR